MISSTKSRGRRAPTSEVEERKGALVPNWRGRLSTARGAFTERLSAILARNVLDDETWDLLERSLILSDVGVDAADRLLSTLREEASIRRVRDPAALELMLHAAIVDLLGSGDRTLDRSGSPSVWMFVGVNGSGKTTTIGKLAHAEVGAGRKVILAAGDTFRAAAVEQLQAWAERSGAGIVAGQQGGDPASVVYDAIEHARSAGADLVLADTAGRLHSNHNLMAELAKIRRVAAKASGRLCEVLLVLDAAGGQNSLAQAREFGDVAGVTGAVLTKLDGSAKGGVVLGVESSLNLRVKLVGLGEGPEDLAPFDVKEFADALLGVDG